MTLQDLSYQVFELLNPEVCARLLHVLALHAHGYCGASPANVCEQVLLAPLQSGNVLTAGGSDAKNNVFTTAEVFDVKTHLWTSVGSMVVARQYHQVRAGALCCSGGPCATSKLTCGRP